MTLPTGFNPNNMSFGNLPKTTPVIEIPRNTSTYTSYRSWSTSHRESLWSRFNNGVASIGNWFTEKAEDVLGWFKIIAMAIIVITCIVKVVEAWIDDGFWMALLMAIGVYIGGVITWYIATIAIVIGINIVMYGFRLLFWNGWTLLMSIILTVAGWLWIANSTNHYFHQESPKTEVVLPTTKSYQCIAKVLNIRTAPNTYSNVIGTLRKGQIVEVYDISNGFARILYNDQTGYVSLKYLRQY